ncbi:hypothetical protein BHE74_00015324 [Ensete ventricosum]|nr:hypothetical protein GW17_00024343 [Ensete ventricosum]RWW76578.1 hypothetical protein BHE74_00015324 [Ensete ventricosum]RZR75710.1 hypothetical protein BHM03_00000190 [Ensete ventricosum]
MSESSTIPREKTAGGTGIERVARRRRLSRRSKGDDEGLKRRSRRRALGLPFSSSPPLFCSHLVKELSSELAGRGNWICCLLLYKEQGLDSRLKPYMTSGVSFWRQRRYVVRCN